MFIGFQGKGSINRAQNRRHLSRDFILELLAAPKRTGGANVDHEDDGELPLLSMLLDVGAARTSGDVPVDVPDIIPMIRRDLNIPIIL